MEFVRVKISLTAGPSLGMIEGGGWKWKPGTTYADLGGEHRLSLLLFFWEHVSTETLWQ